MAGTRKSEKSITAKRRFFNPTENYVDTNNDERREYDSKLMPRKDLGALLLVLLKWLLTLILVINLYALNQHLWVV